MEAHIYTDMFTITSLKVWHSMNNIHFILNQLFYISILV